MHVDGADLASHEVVPNTNVIEVRWDEQGCVGLLDPQQLGQHRLREVLEPSIVLKCRGVAWDTLEHLMIAQPRIDTPQ